MSTANNKFFLKKLVTCAIMLSLATLLSIIPPFAAPLGGSVTYGSMVPIILITLIFGMKWGLFTSITYSLVQLLLGFSSVASWGLSFGVFIGCLVIDYFLAFSVLGFAGFFGKKKITNIIAGTVFVCFLRYICHFLSGLLFFGSWAAEGFNAFTWALFYNAGYMIPETIITVIFTIALSRMIPFFEKMYN